MAGKSNIEWCTDTWNPIRGCSRVSAGCMNCYAERQAIRQIGSGYAGLIKRTSHGPAWTGEVRCIPELLDQPLRWTKPRRVFVNSMSDLFHESVPFSCVDDVFAVMALTPRHTFQVLTKRPERMHQYVTGCAGLMASFERQAVVKGRAWSMLGTMPKYKHEGIMQRPWPLPNVWLGVSVEDQETADERIPLLLQTLAAVRYVSYEPALGPVDFDSSRPEGFERRDGEWSLAHNYLTGFRATSPYSGINGPKLDWVIVGGESGPKARPCDIAWIRSTVEQCKAADVRCFVKQLGAQPEFDQGCGDCDPCIGGGKCCVGSVRVRLILQDRKGGDMAEWPEDLRVREYPK